MLSKIKNTEYEKMKENILEEIKSEKVMDQQEIMERLSSIGRQEPRENYYKAEKTVNGETVIEENKYITTPNVEEATRAMEMLGKRYVMWTDKQEISGGIAVTFVDDIGSDSDDS